ncbi:MAG TPA: PAS domain S-box protein, partial [Clostridia bacterium]|nr:PAS domain S-box protein [Clostridia bacterium]
LGMGLGDLCPPDDEETKDLVRHYLTDAEAVRGGRSSILRHRKKDGTIIDVELKWNPIAFGGRVACLAMANDITERTRTAHRDAALSKLGQNLSCAVSPGDAAEIIRSVADALFSWDVFTLDLYRANTDDIYSILKVDTDREGRRYVIPSEPNGWAPTPMARRVMDQGAQLILRTEPVSDGRDSRLIGHEQRPSASLMLVPLRGRAGTIGVLSVQSYTLNAYNEEELHRLQTLADHCAGALERIAAEQALHESQQRFRNLFEGSPDAIIVQDYSGHILDVNPAGCLLHGQTREQMLGRGFLETVPEERREEAVRGFSGLVDGSIKHHEGFCLGPGGNVVPVEMRGNRIEYDGQPAVLVHIRDMSAHRRLEDQLRQSQKMEAIGQLAGGVAHDFNNILTVIHGHGSLLLCAANLTGPPARSAQQIVQAAERAAALTRQLLAFSRRQIMQARRLDMNEVVTNMSRMLGRILGEDISVRLHYHSQPAVILGDSGMMEQVLLNLAVNARDAMPQGGVLTIKLTLTDHLSANTSLYPGAKPGSYVCLTVTDTGCGIPAANLTRVFEPFFTTKQAGKGTGLGLATVYGIVRQHQGWVDVQSEVDHGSTFRVYLPAMSHAPSANQDCPAENPVVGGKETILVVEDEDSVRELVCQLLKRHGYHILQASSGVKALELWKECREKVDLLLTDLVMPDRVNGRELAEQLWSDRPGLKVLFTSGYSAEVVGKDFVLQQGLNYLQKPYKPERLARAVRESLDAVN